MDVQKDRVLVLLTAERELMVQRGVIIFLVGAAALHTCETHVEALRVLRRQETLRALVFVDWAVLKRLGHEFGPVVAHVIRLHL